MTPDDVRWPAVREAARRILRTPHVRLEVPDEHMHLARDLVSAIAESNPARLVLPELTASATFTVIDAETNIPLVVWEREAPQNVLLFRPDGQNQVTFHDVFSMAHELVEAGYPGCLGCGGPGLEAPWDELTWRSRQDTTSFK